MANNLSPATLDTLFERLYNAVEYYPKWVDRYFPVVADRGHPEYADLEDMSPLQAEAVRVRLMQELEFVAKKSRPAPSIMPLLEENVNGFALRTDRYKEALEDLCEVFTLRVPAFR